jgi:hypothetical protein
MLELKNASKFIPAWEKGAFMMSQIVMNKISKKILPRSVRGLLPIPRF